MARLGCVLTRVAVRLVDEAGKGLRVTRALLDRLSGRGRRLARRGSTPSPCPIQEQAEAEQSEQQEYVEKQVVSHVVPLPG